MEFDFESKVDIYISLQHGIRFRHILRFVSCRTLLKKSFQKYNRIRDHHKRPATSCFPVHFDQQLYDRAIQRLETSYFTKCATQFDSYFASDYYDRYIASKTQAVEPNVTSHFDSTLYDQELLDRYQLHLAFARHQANSALDDQQFF